MRKIISLVLAILLLPTFASAITDVEQDAIYKVSVDRLVTLGVFNGFADGTFLPEQPITRAQFAKIACIVSNMAVDISNKTAAGIFNDLSEDYWANGYIMAVNQTGLISGYPNGTFDPEKNLTYAEVITILVRLLDYTAADVGYYWPNGYLEKARVLGITDGLYFDSSDTVTRGMTALLLDRTLFTEIKKQTANAQDIKLISKMNITILEEQIVQGTSMTDPALPHDEIRTENGTYKLLCDMPYDLSGQKIDVLLDKNNRIIEIMTPYTQDVTTAVIEQYFNNQVTLSLSDGSTRVIRPDDNTIVYYKGTKSTFAQQKERIIEGNELHFFGGVDMPQYVWLFENDALDPVTIRGGVDDALYELGASRTSTMYRDGKNCTASDLMRYDVLYYTPKTDTVYAYSDKVTGTYDKAFPIKARVTGISLSGVTYQIETPTAISRLDETAGSFKIGDRITLLLGRNGEIADVVDLGGGDPTSYGIVMSTYSQLSDQEHEKGKTVYYTRIHRADGVEIDIKSDKDYKNQIGRFVTIDYANSLARLTSVTENVITGKIDRSELTIGGVKLAQGFKIIEMLRSEAFTTPTVRNIELSDISVSEISAKQCVHAQVDSRFGDIVVLVVENITSDNYTFGLMKTFSNSTSGSISGSYTVYVDGVEKTYRSSGTAYTFNMTIGVGVAMDLEGDKLLGLYNMPKIVTMGKLEALSFDRIKVDGVVYPVKDALSYRKTDLFEYKSMAQLTAEAGAGKRVDIYADKRIDAGGRIRLIVFYD